MKNPREARVGLERFVNGLKACSTTSLLGFGEAFGAFGVVDAAPFAHAAVAAEGDFLAVPVGGGAVGGEGAVGLHGAEGVDGAHVGGGFGCVGACAAGEGEQRESGECEKFVHG